MMKSIGCIHLVLTMLLIFACGGSELTLDCSTPETFASSSEAMMKHLVENGSPRDQGAFAKGMLKITMAFTMDKQSEKALKKYHGWTLSQVIAHGQK